MSQFSEEFQKCLRRANLTQSDIAREAKISTGLISQYASASVKMSPVVLRKLLKALHVKFWPHLVAAHLADETPVGAEWSVTVIKNLPEANQLTEEPPDARTDFERAMDGIRNLGVDRSEVRGLMISLAGALSVQFHKAEHTTKKSPRTQG